MLPRLRFFFVTLAMLLLLAGAAFNFIGHSPRASGLSIGMRSAMGSPLDLALGENIAWRDRRHVLAAALRSDELARLRDLPGPIIQSQAEPPIPAAPSEQLTATASMPAMKAADLPIAASGVPVATNDAPALQVETPAPSTLQAAGQAERQVANPPPSAADTEPSPVPAGPIVQAEELMAPVKSAVPAETPVAQVEPALPAETPVAQVESVVPADAPAMMQPGPIGRAEPRVKQPESALAAQTPIGEAPAISDAPSPASAANDSVATLSAEMDVGPAIAARSHPDISGAEETAFRSLTSAEDLISAPAIAPAALRNTAPNERHSVPDTSEQAKPVAEDAAGGVAPSSPPSLPHIIVEDVQAAPAIAPAARKATRKRARARRVATRGRPQSPPPAASAVAPFSLPTFNFSATPLQPQRPTQRPAQARTRTTSPAPSFYAGPGAIPVSQ